MCLGIGILFLYRAFLEFSKGILWVGAFIINEKEFFLEGSSYLVKYSVAVISNL